MNDIFIQGSDTHSLSRVLIAAVGFLFDAYLSSLPNGTQAASSRLDLLCENIIAFCKKRSMIRQSITQMIQV